MIDLTINKTGLEHNIQKAKENNIIIPTIAQMQNPDLIPEKIKAKLSHTGLWDVDPVNLFRISWHNEAKEQGGLFQAVPNYVEIPSKLSGVPCRIIAMSGKWFPTGCHKVGASFGCLAPRLVTGQFDATYHHAVWPSTGNYCRGGAFNSKLLACESVAILPQDMLNKVQEKYGVPNIIMTMGGDGSAVLCGDEYWTVESVKVENVVNTAGAGDGYMAATVAQLILGKDLKEATHWASKYAALSVTIDGTIPAYRPMDEVEEFIKSLG